MKFLDLQKPPPPKHGLDSVEIWNRDCVRRSTGSGLGPKSFNPICFPRLCRPHNCTDELFGPEASKRKWLSKNIAFLGHAVEFHDVCSVGFCGVEYVHSNSESSICFFRDKFTIFVYPVPVYRERSIPELASIFGKVGTG